ncbi:glycoside hydrolase family 7 protein [Hebeloma cylindrosporum]|uniref:Glucanase n=1 Tax=Hebeloma cylindrosporum TaxID=76867 RepID=A0A0C3C4M7_HEBCY|nr:glycoside hydrolase family 7 protein [Hebeloma cylindrosporum h7]
MVPRIPRAALLTLSFGAAIVRGQLVGTYQTETHPKLPFQSCTKSGGCTNVGDGQIVLDANWRWIHHKDSATNCYTGNTWDTSVCPDGKTCAANCAVDGADYSGNYGISVAGDALTLKFVTNNSNGKNIGSRVYLMNSDSEYQLFKVLNKEFTFDVDVSNLPCGLNGALYLSEMDADGGLAKFPSNKAGAKYGTGYCDSQCPKDIKFINGEANVEGWTPSATDPNSGTGNDGTCCNEMDIWEANSISSAFTAHPCTVQGQTICSGAQCNTPTDRYNGLCDPDGCDFNSYRMGNTTFFGPGLIVDTTKKITVVTQFLTSDNTANGNLTEIRRIYVQDGKVIQNSKVNIPGMSAYDSITEDFCTSQKTAVGDPNSFKSKGGMKGIETALRNGMVLALSIWDDQQAQMLWLDSTYPVSSTNPGAVRGSCSTTSGAPTDVESNNANASVTYSNIKIGDIGSTFGKTDTSTKSTSTAGNPPVSTPYSRSSTFSPPASTPYPPVSTPSAPSCAVRPKRR